MTDGSVIERTIPATLGHPSAPLSAEQTTAKQDLALELAGLTANSRLRADPLSYFSSPGTA
jgi:hypothetical protein